MTHSVNPNIKGAHDRREKLLGVGESVTVQMEVSIDELPPPNSAPVSARTRPARPGSAAPRRTTPGSEVAAVAERPTWRPTSARPRLQHHPRPAHEAVLSAVDI